MKSRNCGIGLRSAVDKAGGCTGLGLPCTRGEGREDGLDRDARGEGRGVGLDEVPPMEVLE